MAVNIASYHTFHEEELQYKNQVTSTAVAPSTFGLVDLPTMLAAVLLLLLPLLVTAKATVNDQIAQLENSNSPLLQVRRSGVQSLKILTFLPSIRRSLLRISYPKVFILTTTVRLLFVRKGCYE